MDNKELIMKFYESFSKRDVEGMISCYDDNIIFFDPAFGELKGNDAKAMWRMLNENNRGGLKITFNNVIANEKAGSANWIAEYTFSQTGRPVINKISATFEFKNGKIIKHTDYFNLWKWSSQALGLPGYLLGWTPFMKAKIQKRTGGLLKEYQSKK